MSSSANVASVLISVGRVTGIRHVARMRRHMRTLFRVTETSDMYGSCLGGSVRRVDEFHVT